MSDFSDFRDEMARERARNRRRNREPSHHRKIPTPEPLEASKAPERAPKREVHRSPAPFFQILGDTRIPDVGFEPEPEPSASPYGITPRQKEYLRSLFLEARKRQFESLKLYEPLPAQTAFHMSRSRSRIARGSNRAGKAQPVDEPILTPNGWVKIGLLSVGDVVIGGDGKPCLVTGIFPQGVKPVFRVIFDDGAETRCCDEHLWKVKIGAQSRFGKGRDENLWDVVSLSEIRARGGDEPKAHIRAAIPVVVPWMPSRTTLIDPYFLGSLLGDGSFRGPTPTFSTADEEILAAVAGAIPDGHRVSHISRYDHRIIGELGRKHNRLKEACELLGVWGLKSYEKFVPDDYLFNTPEVRLAILQGLMDTDGSIGVRRIKDSGGLETCGSVEFCTTSSRLAQDVVFLVRSLGGKAKIAWRTTHFPYKGEIKEGRPSARVRVSLRSVCPFRLHRKVVKWSKMVRFTRDRILRKIVPNGDAECVCISVSSTDHTYVTRDLIVTHNTLASMCELGYAVTGSHPDREKYPLTDGRAIVVARDLEKIGEVVWRKLGRAGAFQIVQDPATGDWRSFRPATDHGIKTKPAPPLLPHRMIREISWESRKASIPKKVMLHNGWEINFYSSNSDPNTIQGIDIDICLSGWSEIYDPVVGEMRRIDSIEGPWHVWSWNEDSGRFEVRPASSPFIKGYGEICRVSLSNGETMFTTRRHQVLASDGHWLSVQEAWERGVSLRGVPPVSSEFLGTGVPSGLSRVTYRTLSPIGPCSMIGRVFGLPRPITISDSEPSTYRGYESSGVPLVIPGVRGSRSRYRSYYRSYGGQPLSGEGTVPDDFPSRGGVPSRNHSIGHGDDPDCTPGCNQRYPGSSSVSSVLRSTWDRICAWSRKLLSVPLPRARMTPRSPRRSRKASFSVQGTSPRSIPGPGPVVGHSLLAFADECSPPSAIVLASGKRSCNGRSAIQCCGPHRRRGESTPRLPGIVEPVPTPFGWSSPSSFASVNPSTLRDEISLIHITNISPHSQSEIWDVTVPVTHNYLYSGVISHNCVFDEEVLHKDWYSEAMARLIDRTGWFWWGATPQAGTQQLYDLHLRAESIAEDREGHDSDYVPEVSEHFLSIWDNPHLSDQAKRDFVSSIDDDERRVRVDGEFAITGLKIYEAYFFPRGLHGVDPFPIPSDWTRYLAIDPGVQVGAVLFCAIPPARYDSKSGIDPGLFGDFVYFYDELYIRTCDARKLAIQLRDHIGDQRIQTFLIDHHGGRLTEIGSGRSPEQQYMDAFKQLKVPKPLNGTWFVYGSDDIDAGILRVKDWLRLRDDGTAKIRILKGTCKNLVDNLNRYQWKVVGGVITDKALNKNCHLCDCARYIALHPGLKYKKPELVKAPARDAYASFTALQERSRKRSGASKGGGVTLA